MKTSRYLVYGTLAFMIASVMGCLKTRAELRGEPTQGQAAQVQNQSVQDVAAAASPQPPQAVPADSSQSKVPLYKQLDQDAQMRELTGRIEVVENQLSQLNASIQANQQQAAKEKADLEIRLKAYEDAIHKLENEYSILDQQVQIIDKRQTTAAAAPVKSKNPLAAADKFYKEKKWKQAIVAYQKYRDAYPKGSHYAQATYRIGRSFEHLKMNKEAKVFFSELAHKYPSSKEGHWAKTRMKTLK